MSDVDTIIAMHRFKRPSGSASEKTFIEEFIQPLGAKEDKHGNFVVQVGPAPRVLWSSHTDTVHRSAGMQRLTYDGRYLKLHRKASSSCLGADDGAGCWLMREMILAKKPGLYIFHAEEEDGCIGSHAIAKNNPELLSGIQAAIAFDRRGYDSVITHMYARVCSDAFAKSLAGQLDGYKLDDTGSLTDTKSYRGIVPECTNISVGYENAHRSNERLDLAHLIWLRDQLLLLDTDKFVIERKPEIEEPKTYTYSKYGRRLSTVEDLLWTYPREAAAVLVKNGITFDAFKALIDEEVDAAFEQKWGVARFKDYEGKGFNSALTQDHTTASILPAGGSGQTNLKVVGNGMATALPASNVTPFPGHVDARDDTLRVKISS